MIDIDKIKGISPGKVICRELVKRDLSQRKFATSLGVHSQTLNAVISGRRDLPLEMALKIEKAFGWEEGSLLVLQTFYKIKCFQSNQTTSSEKPIPLIRDILFWDTNPSRLDWQRQKQFIINRVMERGNSEEKQKITEFYGITSISEL